MGKNSFNGEPGLSTNPLDVQGITNTLGDVQIVDDVVPSVTNAFRVGTTTLRWLSGNMTTTITDNITSLGDINVNPTLETVMVKTLRPSVTGTVSLGTGTFRWGTLHSVNTVTDNISSGGDVNINPTLNVVLVKTTRPSVTNSIDLGTSSFTWATLHATTVQCATVTSPAALTLNPTSDVIMVKTLRPSVTGTVALGTSTFRWGSLESVNTVTDNISSGGDVNINPTLNVVLVKTTRPSVTNSIDLGTASTRWANVHGTTLHCTNLSGPGSSVSLLKPIVSGAGGATIGVSGSEFASVWTTTLQSSTTLTLSGNGGDIILSPHVRPSINNTHNLGTSTFQWANLYAVRVDAPTVGASTGNTTLTAGVGAQLNTNRSLIPTPDLTLSLGDNLTGRWANVHSNRVSTPTLGAVTGSTTLTAGVGAQVITDRTVVPSVDNTHNLGTPLLRWGSLFTFIVEAVTRVTSPLLGAQTGNTTFTAGGGSDIFSERSFLPNVTQTHTLGTNTLRWRQLHCNEVYTDGLQAYGTFSSSLATLPIQTFNKVAITVTGSAYTAPLNQFVVPTKGVYQVSFMSHGDLGVLNNTITYRVYNVTTATAQTYVDYHEIGGTRAISPKKMHFEMVVTTLGEQYELQAANATFSVTNWQVLDGFVIRLSSFI